MRLSNYLVLLFVITISSLSAQNQMALMYTLYGEFNGDEFGSQMLAMDYNGDGYDDLIILSNMWNGTGVYNSEYFLGKIYFYWGGPVFDNIPDFVLEGQQQNDFTGYRTSNIPGMCNAGDMNADGIDDLAITRSYDNVGGIYKSLDVYLGRAIPQTIPDYVITYPQAKLFPRWLGDINNDGKADLAINGRYEVSNSTPFCYIWTDLASAPVLFRSSNYRGGFFLSGVGDVNNDGFADSVMGTPISTNDVKAALYYGDATASMSDSLVISEYLYQAATLNALTLGDINGDGFDDFIGYPSYDYHYIWLGSTELDSIPDLQLSLNTVDHDMNTFSRGARVYAVQGDLNGDAYDDFVCSDPGANGWNGQAGVWLGGPNVNATVDLVLDPPTDWENRNFGHAKAIGDFNGDGLSDLALSCPWWGEGSSFRFPGRVYVYAGNAQLADTTVSNDDPIAPALTTLEGDIHAYPNPGQIKNNAIIISLKGELYSRSGIYSYRLYNIRGQELKQGSISNLELNNRQFSLNISELSAGVYQIVVLIDGNIINSKRIIVY